MDLLCLLGGGDLAGADSPSLRLDEAELRQATRKLPDRLVGDDDLGPVVDLVRNSLELVGDHLDGLVCLTLLQAFSAAQNDTKATVESRLGLARDKCIVFLEDDPTLRVADESPCNTALLQLLRGNFASESAVGLVEDILGSDFDTLAEMLAGEEKVERWRGDDNLFGKISFECLE